MAATIVQCHQYQSYCQKLWMEISGGGFLGFESVDELSYLDQVG